MKSPKVAKPVGGEFQYTLKSKQVQNCLESAQRCRVNGQIKEVKKEKKEKELAKRPG